MKLQPWDAGMIYRIHQSIKTESKNTGLSKLLAKEFGISEGHARRVRYQYAKKVSCETIKTEASCT